MAPRLAGTLSNDSVVTAESGSDSRASAGAEVPVLSVRDLRTVFVVDDGVARAVDGVTFDIRTGETVALVGESGCGKTATALSILRLIEPPGRIEPGAVIAVEGRDVLTLDDRALRAMRGSRVAMVFQEPMTALNPAYSVGEQVAEVVRVHERANRDEAWARAVTMLDAVGIVDASERARWFPHQLSGGARQRVMIAMALVLRPALLIADEPTTALDVTVQAQVLALLDDLQRRYSMAVMLITHDLGVVAELASRVLVMYAGQIVEEAPVGPLFDAPQHPYTEGLLHSIPRADPSRRAADGLAVIPGVVPSATAWPTGCRFHERCPFAWDRCTEEMPPLHRVAAGRYSRCHLVSEPDRRTGRRDRADLSAAGTGPARGSTA